MASGIANRLLHIERVSRFKLEDLITECPKCHRYALACRQHNTYKGSANHCHDRRLIFSDGGLSSNGKFPTATGIGISMGSSEDCQWSVTITQDIDGTSPRTSQRAELLAAIVAVRKALYLQRERDLVYPRQGEIPPEMILATDSSYVVKGITDWIHAWRAKGWRTGKGKEPSNLDLYLLLDSAIRDLENEGVKFGCWLIPRELNVEADALAKSATRPEVAVPAVAAAAAAAAAQAPAPATSL